MSFQLLSNELPRNRRLSWALVAIVLLLALAPFLFPGSKALGVAAKMLVFILLMGEFLIPAILGGGKVFFVDQAFERGTRGKHQ